MGRGDRTPLLSHEGARAGERELREFARANLAHFKAPYTA